MKKVKFKVILILLMCSEVFCNKLENSESFYKEMVNTKAKRVGKLSSLDETVSNKTLETFELCMEEEDDDDPEFTNICLCNLENCVELYCNLNNYLDYEECIQPQNASQSDLNLRILYTYDNLKKYEDGVSLKYLESLDSSFDETGGDVLLMREYEDDKYDFLRVNYKCLRRIFENKKTKPSRWLDNATTSYIINLVSFFSLIFIILLFTLIKELGVGISGKSWIMFSITSLLNYVHVIFLNLYLFSEKKEVEPLYFYISVSVFVLLILCLRIRQLGYGKSWFIFSLFFVFLHLSIFLLDIIIDTNYEMLHYTSWMFHAISYFSTEFSIYFWLNIICFDAFYSTK